MILTASISKGPHSHFNNHNSIPFTTPTRITPASYAVIISSLLLVQNKKEKLFLFSLFIIYYLLKNKNKKARRKCCEYYWKGGCKAVGNKNFLRGWKRKVVAFVLFWPLGIAYNNIQITYRNTSLKSSTLKKENVCDLPTDATLGGREKVGEQFLCLGFGEPAL